LILKAPSATEKKIASKFNYRSNLYLMNEEEQKERKREWRAG
jgi:hypothetical protein